MFCFKQNLLWNLFVFIMLSKVTHTHIIGIKKKSYFSRLELNVSPYINGKSISGSAGYPISFIFSAS